jgi:hypothetical protein
MRAIHCLPFLRLSIIELKIEVFTISVEQTDDKRNKEVSKVHAVSACIHYTYRTVNIAQET